MSLYEVKSALPAIINKTIEERRELDAHLSLEDVEQQAIDIAKYIKNLELEELGIANAIKDMTERKKNITYRIDALTDFVKKQLEINNVKEITSSPYFKIKVKKCPPKVEVDATQEVPEEYLRKKEVIEIDKAKISDELKNGVLLPFAKLIQSTRLEIK